MSILIKGMEMPEMRRAYAGLIIRWDGEVFPFFPPQGYELGESIASAVPIPPHGRLIDADAVLQDLLSPSKEFERGMSELVGDAPTIIPADKKGE